MKHTFAVTILDETDGRGVNFSVSTDTTDPVKAQMVLTKAFARVLATFFEVKEKGVGA